MKISYITHACLLVEAGGVLVLMDPWLVGSCWGGNIWHYPPPKMLPEDFADIDYVYFSHAHDDHFHPPSLRRLRGEVKGAQVIIPDFGARYFERAVRGAGFGKLRLLGHEETCELAPGVRIEMLVNERGDQDSSLLMHADGVTVLFQTDNLLSIPEAQRLGKRHAIDAVFTITSLTGIFPAFYEFPADTLTRLAGEKRTRSLNYSMDIVTALGARFAIPYASDFCYLGELSFANDLHAADKRDFLSLAKARGIETEIILMGPGDVLEIDQREIRRQLSTQDFGMENLAAYAVAKRSEVAAACLQERRHQATSFLPDMEAFRAALDERALRWAGASFRVLWKIVGDRGETHTFGQELPKATESCTADWSYDLAIEMPAYRLQRLVRGDYEMGMITLWNGAIRCHRHVEALTQSESQFWAWAVNNLHFGKRP